MFRRISAWVNQLFKGDNTAELRAAFLMSRRYVWQEDDDFVGDVVPKGSPLQCAIAKALRRVIADECGIAAELIVAGDRTSELLGIMGPSFVYGSTNYDYVHVRSMVARFVNDTLGLDCEPYLKGVAALRTFGPERNDLASAESTFGEWINECLAPDNGWKRADFGEL